MRYFQHGVSMPDSMSDQAPNQITRAGIVYVMLGLVVPIFLAMAALAGVMTLVLPAGHWEALAQSLAFRGLSYAMSMALFAGLMVTAITLKPRISPTTMTVMSFGGGAAFLVGFLGAFCVQYSHPLCLPFLALGGLGGLSLAMAMTYPTHPATS